MLDIKLIRENPKHMKESLKKKGVDVDIENILELDERRRAKIKEVDDMRARHHRASEEIPSLSGTEKKKRIAGMKEEKAGLERAESELKSIEEAFREKLYQLPNPPLDDVPVGKGGARMSCSAKSEKSLNSVLRRAIISNWEKNSI